MKKFLTRRAFLERAGKASIAGAAFYFNFLSGCAPFPKEERDHVSQLEWKCNPVLPVPANGGIYIGTNKNSCLFTSEKDVVHSFEKKYGKNPTFVAPGKGRVGAADYRFPWDKINAAHQMGAIPMIRYVVNPKKRWWGTLPKFSTRQGFRWIYKGSSDDDIKKFGAEAAKLTKPIIIVPFQQVNDYNNELYPWAGPHSAGPFKETYVRIYDIWKQEGALENVVMALKLKVGRWEQWQYPDPLRYIPPIDKVDIIGWCVNNHCQPHRNTPSLSFKKLFKSTYSRTVAKYNNTPQFIWELACNSRCNQDVWLEDALTNIENKYYWIKAVNLDECSDGKGSFIVYPAPLGKSIEVVRNHFTKPIYIGNILPQNKA